MTNTKVESKTRIKTFPFDAAETLDSPEAIAEYLTAALESADASFIAKAIGTAARACGMSEIARKSGLSHENLVAQETRTELDTVVRVMTALGVRLTVLDFDSETIAVTQGPCGKTRHILSWPRFFWTPDSPLEPRRNGPHERQCSWIVCCCFCWSCGKRGRAQPVHTFHRTRRATWRLAPGQRWSVGRKREVVLRLLQGESAEDLSRELGVPSYRLERWHERVSGIDGSLREREGDAVSEELAAAMKRIGELTMENEVLRTRVELSALWPGGGRGDGRRDLAWHRPSLRRHARL